MIPFYERPIINPPQEAPSLYHPLDDAGRPIESEPIEGRRYRAPSRRRPLPVESLSPHRV